MFYFGLTVCSKEVLTFNLNSFEEGSVSLLPMYSKMKFIILLLCLERRKKLPCDQAGFINGLREIETFVCKNSNLLCNLELCPQFGEFSHLVATYFLKSVARLLTVGQFFSLSLTPKIRDYFIS